MADELTLFLGLKFEKGGSLDELVKTLQLDVTGTQSIHHRQSIGTSAEALDVGDLGTLGYGIFWNHDATNYIELRDGSGGADLVKLKPGEIAIFRLATNTPYAIADTGACELEYIIVED